MANAVKINLFINFSFFENRKQYSLHPVGLVRIMKAWIVMTTEGLREIPRLSLTRGGLFYRVEKRLGLADTSGFGIEKRILAFWCVTWLPVFAFEIARALLSRHFEGIRQIHSTSSLIFDFRIIVRLLIAAPILIAAELPIELRLNRMLSQLMERKLIDTPHDLSVIIQNANRRVSGMIGTWMELGLLLLSIVLVTHPSGTLPSEKLQGWYYWIAMPLFQFLQLRWIWRFSIWTTVLWRISKLKLRLFAEHPDLTGGLGILAFAQKSFAILWIAISAGAATTVAFRILEDKKTLSYFYEVIAAFVGIESLLLLAPLVLFVPHILVARREGLLNYGRLSSEYVSLFERKWIATKPSTQDETLLGSSDIQSLADLGNGFDRVSKMRIFPADKRSIIGIVVAGILPFLPLSLLEIRLEDLLRATVKLLH